MEWEKEISFFKTRPHTLESTENNLVKDRVKDDKNIDLSSNFLFQTLLGLLPKSF